MPLRKIQPPATQRAATFSKRYATFSGVTAGREGGRLVMLALEICPRTMQQNIPHTEYRLGKAAVCGQELGQAVRPLPARKAWG